MAGLIPLSIMPVIGSIFGILISLLTCGAVFFLYRKFVPLSSYLYGPAMQVKELSQKYAEAVAELETSLAATSPADSSELSDAGSPKVLPAQAALAQLIRSYREDLNQLFAPHYFAKRRKEYTQANNHFQQEYARIWQLTAQGSSQLSVKDRKTSGSVPSTITYTAPLQNQTNSSPEYYHPDLHDNFVLYERARREQFLIAKLAHTYLSRSNIFVYLPLEELYQQVLALTETSQEQAIQAYCQEFQQILQSLPQERLFSSASASASIVNVAWSFLPTYLPKKVSLPVPLLVENAFTDKDLALNVTELAQDMASFSLFSAEDSQQVSRRLTTLNKAGQKLCRQLYYRPKRFRQIPVLTVLLFLIALIPGALGLTQGYYLSLQYRAQNLIKELDSTDLFTDFIGGIPLSANSASSQTPKPRPELPQLHLDQGKQEQFTTALSLWKKGTHSWFVSNSWLAAYNTGTLEALTGDYAAAEKSFAQALQTLPSADLFYRSESLFLARCRLAENALNTAELVHGDNYFTSASSKKYLNFCTETQVESLVGFSQMSGEMPDAGALAEIKYYVSLNQERQEKIH